MEKDYKLQTYVAVGIGLVVVISLVLGFSWVRPWIAEQKGKAILAEATNSRLARVEAAKAEKEAAQYTADAIKIVGEAAKEYPEYRTQEFILSFGDALKEGTINQIMYIPTEANIPITEASRLFKVEK